MSPGGKLLICTIKIFKSLNYIRISFFVDTEGDSDKSRTSLPRRERVKPIDPGVIKDCTM